MREGWKEVKLEDLCVSVKSGGTPSTKRSDFYGGEIPWIKTKEVNFNRIYDSENKITELGLKNSSAKLIPARSIIIAMYGNGDTAGRCAINMIPLSTNQACSNFTFNEKIACPEFMFYKITTHYRDFVHLKSGGAQNNLNGRTLKDFKVEIPPLTTQRKIASILSAYDDLIENNLKRIALLEEQAQQTYEEWFVRLKFPGHESVAIDAVSGLPEGWEKVKVGDLIGKVKSTTKIKSSEILDKGKIPVIDQSRTFIKGFTDNNDALINIKEPIIVFGDHTRILKFVNFPFARGADGTQVILSKNERMPQHLFYFTLLDIDLSNYHYARHYKFLKDCDIVLPNKKEAVEFEALTKQIFDLILNLQTQNQLLKEARDILLPRLMSGMIDPWAGTEKVEEQLENELAMAAEPEGEYNSKKQ